MYYDIKVKTVYGLKTENKRQNKQRLGPKAIQASTIHERENTRFILVIEGKALITDAPSALLMHQQCSLNQEQFMAFTVGRQVSGPNRL